MSEHSDPYTHCPHGPAHRGTPGMLVPIIDGVCGRGVHCQHSESCEHAVVMMLRAQQRRLDALEAALRVRTQLSGPAQSRYLDIDGEREGGR